jgi:hypothetical protein
MALYITVQGTAEFAAAAKKFKAAGRGELTRAMAQEMRRSAEPVRSAAARSIQGLPIQGHRASGGARARAEFALRRRGGIRGAKIRAVRKARAGAGLRATIARAIRAEVKTGGSSASVRIRVQRRHLPPDQRKLPVYLNTGRWRHPVFGNRRAWVAQTAPPAWWDDTMRREGPPARDRAVDAVFDTLKKLG